MSSSYPRRRKRTRPVTYDDRLAIALAYATLKRTRDQLRAAEAFSAARAVSRALKSVNGAHRHALRMTARGPGRQS